jgi:vesicle transport through interaction with t-SNAREs protein 1
MSIFDAYDQEFTSLTQEINKSIQELKNEKGDKSSSLIRLIEGLFSQSSDLIKQMEVEVRSHDPQTRKVLNDKVGQYKKSVASLKTDFERTKEQSKRSALIGDRSAGDRQRLLDGNDKIRQQNDTILRAHQTVMETEDVALEITSELSRNREKIESARGKVSDFYTVIAFVRYNYFL